MIIKRLLSLIVLVLVFTGCDESSFSISGKITGAEEGSIIYLDKLGSQTLEPYDSTEINSEGYFLIEGEITAPEFFLLRTDEESFLTTLIESGDNMSISAQWDSLNSPDFLEGSPGTELMFQYNLRLIQAIEDLSSLSEIYNANIDSPNLEDIMGDLDNRAQGILKEMTDYTKDYIDKNLSSMVSMVALYQQISPGVYVMNPEENLDYFLRVDSALYSMYPESEPIINFHEQITMLEEAMNTQESPEAGLSVGSMAPDFSLPDAEGNEISLSSTRGKVVLLDFWAAWCPPCRQESPNLVAAFEKYSKDGFDIFQVSLDQTREAWLKGIEDDKLGAWTHVSDLQYWNSAIVPVYQIQSIPANYLLDRDGKIIASNLRGEALINKLKEIF